MILDSIFSIDDEVINMHYITEICIFIANILRDVHSFQYTENYKGKSTFKLHKN